MVSVSAPSSMNWASLSPATTTTFLRRPSRSSTSSSFCFSYFRVHLSCADGFQTESCWRTPSTQHGMRPFTIDGPGDITGLLTYLRGRSADDPLLVGLRDTLAGAEKRPPLAPDFVLKVQSWITNGYSALVSSRRLNSAILALFVVYAVVVVIAIVVATVESRGMIHFDVDQSTVDYAGIAVSNTMTTLLIVVGIWRLPKSRLAALRWFDRAVVLDLLLAQVFNFYQAQFGALIGTGIDVLVLLLVRGMMRVEELQS